MLYSFNIDNKLSMFCFNKSNKKPHVNRFFEPNYFNGNEIFDEYKENGFLIFRNTVENEYIEEMRKLYDEISKMDDFILSDTFLNSGRLDSTKIRSIVVDKIKIISTQILSKIINSDNATINTGGAFQIKPASKNSILNPHQDTPIIDETKNYAVYVWIPLCDTDVTNGCLSLIPKSHLWGNYQRSLNVPWKYENETKALWKKMIDVPLKKGDLICFDSALIHGSKANVSTSTRLAFTTVVLPKNYQLIHYFRDNKTPKDKVEVYAVDEAFFYSEDIMKRPPERYELIRLEDWNR